MVKTKNKYLEGSNWAEQTGKDRREMRDRAAEEATGSGLSACKKELLNARALTAHRPRRGAEPGRKRSYHRDRPPANPIPTTATKGRKVARRSC